ncbi:hypothetical protein Taro_041269 [Colocasia esculenta]|uniref:Protein EARLY HEADING DATE 2 n=1 Tax=Colocasia esculenta TaxID=4460 RepID=A0A843WL59_COLES|nr:hypothetical protein [Colocasia esculenta]
MKELIIQQHHHHHQPVVAEENMSNLTSASGEASVSSNQQSFASPNPNPTKKKRNLPGNPDPDAEVIALSPKTLLATNRFVCEICGKGFQRDQNLQLHRRGHNLPWKLKQRTPGKEVRKKVYICPEVACVHHDPSRALGDLTGIKKHFCRKHGEKKWKCEKCSKKYAVQSDWKAHSKTCGTREYRCDCGTLFSRRDSFITHRAFCDALAEESARVITAANPAMSGHHPLLFSQPAVAALQDHQPAPHATLQAQIAYTNNAATSGHGLQDLSLKREQQQQFSTRPEVPAWLGGPPAPAAPLHHLDLPTFLFPTRLEHGLPQENQSPAAGTTLPAPPYNACSPHMSATALLQKAAQMGSSMSRQTSHGQILAVHAGGAGSTAAAAPGGLVMQDLMMGSFSSASGDGGCFEEASGWILGSGGEVSASCGGRSDGGGGGAAAADGLTRDFLGLRALSHRDILSMAGLEPCMSSSSYEQKQPSKKPWSSR